MKNKLFRDSSWFSFALVLMAAATLSGQSKQLRDLDVVRREGFVRVLVNCTGELKHKEELDRDGLRLTLYLSDVGIELVQPEKVFERGVVRRLAAQPWSERPSVTRVDIFMREPFEYTVQEALKSLLFVDIRPIVGIESGVAAQTDDAEQADGITPASVAPTQVARHTRVLSEKEQDDEYALLALNNREQISIDVNAAEVSNVLRLMAKQSGLNIVASNEVVGKVTVSLAGVTIKEALDMVVKANGFDYAVAGEVILVKPRNKFEAGELETKIYRLRYIDANNIRETVKQVVSPQAKIQVFYHNFNEVKTVEGEGDAEAGQKKNTRSSTLIVTDSAANLRQVEAMIAALDLPTPQIMIEAKLVEVSPQNELQLGIDWDKSVTGEIFREIILPSGTPNQIAADIPLEGGDITYGTLSIQKYAAVLNFLSSKTNSKLVSNPRIIATDNEEAVISVGTTFPIPQINRGVGGQGDVVSFEYRDVNISLRVTPHVGENETVSLFVNPVVEEVIGEVIAAGNSAPITSLRTVETVVTLKNNETMVIGGLIRENTIDTVSKVWLLGDIPLVGNFFRNREKMAKQTDLLIFITPRIVGTF